MVEAKIANTDEHDEIPESRELLMIRSCVEALEGDAITCPKKEFVQDHVQRKR